MEKFSFKSLLTIIVVLLIGIVGLWRIQQSAKKVSAWFNDSWQYRKAITIGNTGSQISNAQVQVLTDYDISSLVSAGKIGSSLNDIRFTDINGQLLHYWIQDYTNNSTNIWVLIPKLLSGTQKIYMYYGNSSAKENSESHWVADLGGTISSFNGYRIHAFLNNDTYTNLVDRQADVLVIAGGGGGGRRHGAGGGAGGLIYQTNFNITSDIGVTVGAGGLGATSVQNSQNGSNSTFSSLTAIGGGFGGSYDASRDGASGGSGGGSTTLNVAVGTVGQGNSGGTGYTASSPYNWGGGGGAGEAGHNGTSNSHGNGGDGLYYGDLYSTGYGESGWFAGGGGGGGHDPAATYQGIGGTGGGGNGGTPGVNTPGEDGQDNTGGGGGGAATPSGGSGKGGDGGSGIVLVRYESTIDTSANASISSPATEEQSLAPIAYWKFDEGVGTTVYDSSSNNNNGLITGATWQTEASCISGQCLNFNGTSAYLKTINTIQNAKSISMWINIPSSQTSWKYLLDARTGLTNGYFAAAGIGGPWSKMYVNGIEKTVSWANIPKDNWVHLYIESSSNFNDDINFMSRYSDNQFIAGSIDEIKIYAYARTAAQIKQDYNAGKANIGALKGGAINIGGTQTSNFKDSLIAHYKFDEGYGTTVHNTGTSGSAYNGTFATGTSAPTWTMGKNNKGLSFGGNDYVSIGDTGALNFTSSFTISAWIKTTQDLGTGNYGAILGKGHLQVANGYGFFIDGDDSDHVTFQVRNGSKIASLSSSTINDNQWHHIVGVRDHDNNTSYFYVDGNLIGSTLVALSSGYVSSKPFGIGGRNDNTWNYYYSGLIDDVKIYNYALTADEVKLDYNQGAQFVMGKSNQTIGGTTTSLDYCIPGDTSACSAPIGEWKFEEGVGSSTYDTSGSSYHGVWNVSEGWTTGKIGKGANFTGSNSISTSSNVNLTGDATISMWINPGSTQVQYADIFSKHTNNYCFEQYSTTTNKYYFAWYNGSSYECNATDNAIQLTPNIWQHVTIRKSGTQLNYYINGIVQSVGCTGSSATISTSTALLYFGRFSTGGSRYFNGKLDQVKIYNYARTPAQIAYDYNKGAPIGHWKMDECEGNIVHDASGLGNTGTITIGSGGSQVQLGTCGAGDTTAWSNGSTGKINSAMSFDGTDDYISMGDNSTLKPSSVITLTAWFNTTNKTASGQRIISKTQTSGYQLSLNETTACDSTNLCFVIRIGSNYYTATYPVSNLSNNTWYHVAGSYDGSTVKLFLNGMNIGTTSTVSGTITQTTCPVCVGSEPTSSSCSDGGGNFYGKIDDVRIYNYALTSEQVKQVYNGGAVNFR